MYVKITGSRAAKLDNITIRMGNSSMENIPTTSCTKKELLYNVISEELDKAEMELTLQLSVLDHIRETLSLAPSDFVDKEVYEFRLKNLYALYYISNEIKDIVTEENVSNEKMALKINEIDALLQVSNHGPLRNLLEKEMKKIKSEIESQHKEKVSVENMVEFINSAQSAEEIDEIFCEMAVEEYVNLEGERREIVSTQFFNLSNPYASNKEVMDELYKLISKFNKESQNNKHYKEDGKVKPVNDNGFFKQTLDIRDLEYLIKANQIRIL